MEVIVTTETFEAEVLQSEKPVLVDFWAPRCGPCRKLGPTITKVAEEYADSWKVCKLDVDQEPDVSHRYGITSIPTLIVFKNGEPVTQSVGLIPKAEVEALMK